MEEMTLDEILGGGSNNNNYNNNNNKIENNNYDAKPDLTNQSRRGK